MRVLVFSPVRLFSEGLAITLGEDEEVAEVACCYHADRLIQQVVDFSPDLVLMDVTNEASLKEGRAVAAACPGVPMIALALPELSEKVIACADAGFVSYVPRHASVLHLRAAIEMALKGEVACDPKISGDLIRELWLRRARRTEQAPSAHLTQRESEVLRALGRGFSNKQIARELSVSEATVKNHVHSILGKLNVKRRAEVMARLREEPWLVRSA